MTFVDISGRVSRAIDEGSHLAAGAVSIPAQECASLLRDLPPDLPKFAQATLEQVSAVVDLLAERAAGLGVLRLDRNTPLWEAFWNDNERVQQEVAKDGNRAASFLRPANIVVLDLHRAASTTAMATAVRGGTTASLLNAEGLAVVRHDVVSDSEIQGADVIALYGETHDATNNQQPRLRSLGFQLVSTGRVSREQDDPLLLLPDYLAGLALRAVTPARPDFEVSPDDAKRLLSKLHQAGKFALRDERFNLSYESMLGSDLTEFLRPDGSSEVET